MSRFAVVAVACLPALGLGSTAAVAQAALPTAPSPHRLFDPAPLGGQAHAFAGASRAAPEADSRALTLPRALQRAVAANPRLAIADRNVGMAAGRRLQAAAIPNPEVSFELDNAFGSGNFRGLRSAETTLGIGQLIELGGKREARIAAGSAELESAYWEREATRLEILSDTAVAYLNVLGGQRRIQIFDQQIASLGRLTPLLQRRVEAGASSPGEIARAELAADLIRAERERARTALAIARRELAILMGADTVDYPYVVGDLAGVGAPPAFATVLRDLDRHPHLVRWTAVRAQRDAELLSARLKPIPDLRVALAWKHIHEPTDFGTRHDNAVRLGASIAVPVWDQNLGGMLEAGEARAKVEAERAAARAALVLSLAKAYDTMTGAAREIEILRSAALPNAQRAVDALESGYQQGRFTLLEVLDAQSAAAQAALRELEALTSFHTAVATIEGLTGVRLGRAQGRRK